MGANIQPQCQKIMQNSEEPAANSRIVDELSNVNVRDEVETVTPRYLREFPYFADILMPKIPDGFKDISWHNDSTPLWIDEKYGIFLWIDHPDPRQREMHDAQYGLVEAVMTEGSWQMSTTDLGFSTNLWTSLLAELEDWRTTL